MPGFGSVDRQSPSKGKAARPQGEHRCCADQEVRPGRQACQPRHHGGQRSGEGAGDVKLARFQDQWHLVANHGAHQATQAVGDRPHDQHDLSAVPAVQRHRHSGGNGHGKSEGVEPDQHAVLTFRKMSEKDDEDRCRGRHAKDAGINDPEYLAVQDAIPHRAVTNGRQAANEDEADDVELRPAGGQCPGKGKDQDRGVVARCQQGKLRQSGHGVLPLNGAIPARANASARSFSA